MPDTRGHPRAPDAPGEGPRLVVVSNRLPIRVFRDGEAWRARPGAGGLVTALIPVLRAQRGTWLGWPGAADEGEAVDWDDLLARATADIGFDLGAVPLDPRDVELYYEGFSNSIIWPLFHDRVGDCDFDGRFWEGYLRVADRFARVVLERTAPDDVLWIHDYHLFHVGSLVRQQRPDQAIGFFLHIPFPPPDILVRLPWWEELLRVLLAYDQVGVQTVRDLRNLRQCVERLLDVEVHATGRDAVQIRHQGRCTGIEVHPIGIDAEAWTRGARTPEVARQARALTEGMAGAHMVLGVDRLDYTKGLLERLDAWELLLERSPEAHRRAALVLLVVPSREGVARYQTLKSELERKVGAINGRFGAADWTPVRYLYRSVDRNELMALYRAARVGFVSSLKDGMNLVAKEFVACQVDEPGALVLSRFAGASAQLKRGALLVNPHDIAGTADTLLRALELPRDDRARRMRILQRNVHEQDVHRWVERCLAGLGGPARGLSPSAAK